MVGSNTFPDRRSRELTLAVCAAARDRGVPILFDPNLRPGRWPDLEEPRRLSLELAADATLLKCNLGEARWLTGIASGEGEEVATALADSGPQLVVVTAGTAPAVARVPAGRRAPPAVEMVSPLGAGDAFMGALAAGLLAAEWRLADAGEAIERAARAGAEACGRLGAFDRDERRRRARVRARTGGQAAASDLDAAAAFPGAEGMEAARRAGVYGRSATGYASSTARAGTTRTATPSTSSS